VRPRTLVSCQAIEKMTINRGKTLAAGGLLTLLFGSPLAAQDLSAAVRASIEEAARTHVETYYAHFYERDMAPPHRGNSTIPWILLGAGTAFVSRTNTRTAIDGSIMSVGGVTYILGRAEDGWRITSYAGHPVDRAVSC